MQRSLMFWLSARPDDKVITLDALFCFLPSTTIKSVLGDHWQRAIYMKAPISSSAMQRNGMQGEA